MTEPITYHVVLSFDRTDRGRFVPREPVAPTSANAAIRLAQRLSEGVAGVVAFSRTGDPDLGDWEDARILARFGDLPPELGLGDLEPWEETELHKAV